MLNIDALRQEYVRDLHHMVYDFMLNCNRMLLKIIANKGGVHFVLGSNALYLIFMRITFCLEAKYRHKKFIANAIIMSIKVHHC